MTNQLPMKTQITQNLVLWTSTMSMKKWIQGEIEGIFYIDRFQWFHHANCTSINLSVSQWKLTIDSNHHNQLMIYTKYEKLRKSERCSKLRVKVNGTFLYKVRKNFYLTMKKVSKALFHVIFCKFWSFT